MKNSEAVVAGGEATMSEDRYRQHASDTADGVLRVEGTLDRQSAPGSVTEALTAWHFCPDEEPQRVEFDQLPELIKVDANFVWIDLTSYSRDNFHQIVSELHLEPRVARIAFSAWQRPRIEVFGDHFVVTTTVPYLERDTYVVEARELDLVVGKNFLLSIHKLPLAFADRLTARARQDTELVRLDSAFMLYMILDELLAYFEDMDTQLRIQVEQMQQRAFSDSSDDFLSDLLRFKRYAFALQQLADEHRAVFQAFLRPDFPYVSGDEVVEYFRELEVRYTRQSERLQAAQQEVTSAFDIYVSHQAHRTNSIVKVLTMVSALLLPVSVIVSFFGTSFRSIGFLYGPQGFGVMLLAITLVVSGALISFRRRGWL